MTQSFEDAEAFLAHYGVKGMRWGVRRENRIQSLERVGAGTASRGEKTRYALTEATGAAMRRNGGLAGSAANKAANMRAVDARRARGEGSVADFIKAHGGDRLVDTGRVDRDRRVTELIQKNASVKVSTLDKLRENRIERLERVATGTGSKLDKVNVGLTEISRASYIRNESSVAKASGARAANLRAVNDRRSRGEGSARDFVSRYGGDRLVNTGRVDRDLRLTKDNSKPSPTARQKNARKIAATSAGR
jgi:hypothetical protein